MAKRYEISDDEWERIQYLFPVAKTGRPAKWDNKTMLNAILWLARSGSAWRIFPAGILHIKAYTADSASGVTMERWRLFSMP